MPSSRTQVMSSPPAVPHSRPSELALSIAGRYRDTQATPIEAACDLRRLVVDLIQTKSPARLRLGHLDLLIQLVMAFPQVIITEELYKAECALQAKHGHRYVSAASLAEHYYGWLGALTTVETFRDVGGVARVKSTHRDIEKAQAAQAALRATGRKPGYQPQLVQQAIIRCREDLWASLSRARPDENWPNEWEFHAWAKLARRRGMHVPYAKDIRRAFDTYKDAVRITRASVELQARGPAVRATAT